MLSFLELNTIKLKSTAVLESVVDNNCCSAGLLGELGVSDD